MARKVLFLLYSHLTCVMMLIYKKPIAKKVWSEHCTAHSIVLNDCNLCRCDKTHKFTCEARVCNEVDMFGHFNDAIRAINVGMEGHGAWRSTETSCEPGVHYQKGKLLCVCEDSGHWPNPVCRDVFQVLHSVEFKEETQPWNKQCLPGKLHLYDCNVCLCPESGFINSEMCTKEVCLDNEVYSNAKGESIDIVEEVYADCLVDTEYKLGCKSCICLRNNRLICNNCKATNTNMGICHNWEGGEIFNVDCNSCYCNINGLITCTVKKCLKGLEAKVYAKSLNLPNSKFIMVQQPNLDKDCIIGTMYKKNCSNTCYCFEKSGIKTFGCSLNSCLGLKDIDIKVGCVDGTVYKKDCLICHCQVHGAVKREFCQLDHRCNRDLTNRKPKWTSLGSLDGYCEPLHVYRENCNKCKCDTDGETVTCTVNVCEVKKNPISIDFVPVILNIGFCPKGHSYTIDCNICFCLNHGNAICSTDSCKKI